MEIWKKGNIDYDFPPPNVNKFVVEENEKHFCQTFSKGHCLAPLSPPPYKYQTSYFIGRSCPNIEQTITMKETR